MPATLDDVIVAFQGLHAATVQQGGISAALLQSVLHEITAVDSSIMDVTATLQQKHSGGQGGGGGGGKTQAAPKRRGLLRRLGSLFSKGGKAVQMAGQPGGPAALAQAGAEKLATGTGPVGAMSAFAAGIISATRAVNGFVAEQEKVARRLAEVSPSQAAALAQLDVNRIFRDIAQGEATAGSAKKLHEETDKYEKIVAPIKTIWQDFLNRFSARWTEMLAAFAEPWGKLAGKLLPDAPPQPEMFADVLKRVAEEQRLRQADAEARIERVRKAEEEKKKRNRR